MGCECECAPRKPRAKGNGSADRKHISSSGQEVSVCEPSTQSTLPKEWPEVLHTPWHNKWSFPFTFLRESRKYPTNSQMALIHMMPLPVYKEDVKKKIIFNELYILIYHHLSIITLDQQSAHFFFCKGSSGQYFRLCGLQRVFVSFFFFFSFLQLEYWWGFEQSRKRRQDSFGPRLLIPELKKTLKQMSDTWTYL